MAMTATIACLPKTAKNNQPVTATLTVSNSGGSTVNVTSVTPLAFETGAVAADKPNAAVAFGTGTSGISGPPIRVPVTASGTAVLVFQVTFFAASTNSSTYDVGAVLTSDDGSVFSPTADTVTVTQIS